MTAGRGLEREGRLSVPVANFSRSHFPRMTGQSKGREEELLALPWRTFPKLSSSFVSLSLSPKKISLSAVLSMKIENGPNAFSFLFSFFLIIRRAILLKRRKPSTNHPTPRKKDREIERESDRTINFANPSAWTTKGYCPV